MSVTRAPLASEAAPPSLAVFCAPVDGASMWVGFSQRSVLVVRSSSVGARTVEVSDLEFLLIALSS